MLLKRLAFTIYSSEVDQYQKYLPDIQGKQEIRVLLYTITVYRHCMLQQLHASSEGPYPITMQSEHR